MDYETVLRLDRAAEEDPDRALQAAIFRSVVPVTAMRIREQLGDRALAERG